MPLTMADYGRKFTIVNVNGPADLRMKLTNMGITPGTAVRIISRNPSSLLIGFRDTKIMLDSGIAQQIRVQ